MENPINSNVDGDAQDGFEELDIIPNLGEDVNESTEDTNSQDSESLKRDRLVAISQAVKNSKEAEANRAKVEFLESAHEVVLDPEKIQSIYRTDPDLAERIAQKNWNRSYEEVAGMLTSNNSQSANSTPSNVDAIVDRKLREREQKEQAMQIDEYLTTFIDENDINPKSPMFKQIMSEFNENRSLATNLPKAKKLLSMIYADQTQSSRKVDNLSGVFTPRSSSRPQEKVSSTARVVSPQMKAMMIEQKGEEFVKKFLSGK